MFKQLIFASLLDSPIDPSTKAPPISLLIAFNNLSKRQGLQIMTLNQGTRALRYLWCYLSQWGTPLQPWKTCFHNQKLWISPRCARLICCSQAQDGTHRQADDTSGVVSLVHAETNNLCPCNHILSLFLSQNPHVFEFSAGCNILPNEIPSKRGVTEKLNCNSCSRGHPQTSRCVNSQPVECFNPPALLACLVEWGLMMDCLSDLCFCLYGPSWSW